MKSQRNYPDQSSSEPIRPTHRATSDQPIYRATSRKYVAALLGCSTKQLRSWCEQADIKLPSGDLPPRLVQMILREFGPEKE